MKTEDNVFQFEARNRFKIIMRCEKCKGDDDDCNCHKDFRYAVSSYKACLPLKFLGLERHMVKHNISAFDETFDRYIDKIQTARKNGYGLFVRGPVGSGKTFALCYVAYGAIKKGYSTYYTTLSELERNLKLGYQDAKVFYRLRQMLTSTFLVIDDLGKEWIKTKAGGGYSRVQIEKILKERSDNGVPYLLATSLSDDDFEDWYGGGLLKTIEMNCHEVNLSGEDFRNQKAEKVKGMGLK